MANMLPKKHTWFTELTAPAPIPPATHTQRQQSAETSLHGLLDLTINCSDILQTGG